MTEQSIEKLKVNFPKLKQDEKTLEYLKRLQYLIENMPASDSKKKAEQTLRSYRRLTNQQLKDVNNDKLLSTYVPKKANDSYAKFYSEPNKYENIVQKNFL